MDKDGDGHCDSCGMPIAQCIVSGMMECTMDPQAKIGLLGSQHIHADWKIFVDGQPFDWAPYAHLHERQMQGDQTVEGTSAFIHIHPGASPEEPGEVLHMHATGVPLSLFFESLGMSFSKDCLLVSNSQHLCTDGTNSIKFFVNGNPNLEFGEFVFKDGDRILISYGARDADVSEQLASITTFAHRH